MHQNAQARTRRDSMHVQDVSPWLLALASAMAWTTPASAEDLSGAGNWGEGVSVERADWLPRARPALEIAASPLGLPSDRSRAAQLTFHDRRHHGSRHWTHPESYMVLKGGGLFVAEDDGLYLGLEAGGTVDDMVDFGVSLDYFHRRSSERITLGETQFEDLPVEIVATLDESSAHLVPLGLTMRVHLPFGGRTFAPFISGTAAYESSGCWTRTKRSVVSAGKPPQVSTCDCRPTSESTARSAYTEARPTRRSSTRGSRSI
jgi:hypothetical protein